MLFLVNLVAFRRLAWWQKAVSFNIAAMMAHVVRGHWGQHVLKTTLRAFMRANFIALDSRVDGGTSSISGKLLNTFRLLILSVQLL